jgi:hypothetical protein
MALTAATHSPWRELPGEQEGTPAAAGLQRALNKGVERAQVDQRRQRALLHCVQAVQHAHNASCWLCMAEA